jgi:hypothetical protein
MQGVDRLDQLRARFSIADGHSFQKWHKKLAMAFIDIARVNAFVTRKLACRELLTERDPHRSFMVKMTQDLLSGGWQSTINHCQIIYSSLSSKFIFYYSTFLF